MYGFSLPELEMHQGKASPTISEVLHKKDLIQTEVFRQAFSTNPASSHMNGRHRTEMCLSCEFCIKPHSKGHVQHNSGQRENSWTCCFPRTCSATRIPQAKQAEATNNPSLGSSYPFLAIHLVFLSLFVLCLEAIEYCKTNPHCFTFNFSIPKPCTLTVLHKHVVLNPHLKFHPCPCIVVILCSCL